MNELTEADDAHRRFHLIVNGPALIQAQFAEFASERARRA
jgi:hypothetical protein